MRRSSSASTPPSSCAPTDWIKLSESPRSVSGDRSKASDPDKPPSRMPCASWVRSPLARTFAEIPRAGSESARPAPMSAPKPVSASPPSWRNPTSRLGVSTASPPRPNGRDPSSAKRTRVTSACDASRFPPLPDTASVLVRNGKGVGLRSQRRTVITAVEQHPAHPQRPHHEVHVGTKRRLALGGHRERALTVAPHAPHRDPLRQCVACVGEERGQRRLDLAVAVGRAVAALAAAVRDHQPAEQRIAREVRSQHRARHLAVERHLAVTTVEARHRPPAPKAREARLRRPLGQCERRGGEHLAPAERARAKAQSVLVAALAAEPPRQRLQALPRIGSGTPTPPRLQAPVPRCLRCSGLRLCPTGPARAARQSAPAPPRWPARPPCARTAQSTPSVSRPCC